jgi:cytochrome c-type biogenesis protein CcmH/NrfG
VWVNFYLLNAEFPVWITIALVVILAILLIMQLMITRSRSNRYHYDFFSNRVEFYGQRLKSVLFSDVEQMRLNRSFFDRLSGTGTLVLSKDFKIENIKNIF